jgi:predicted RNase H-like HicB family nuclease
MRFQLGVEDIEPGHWIAWVFALPGCFTSASSQDEAVADAPAEIVVYFDWLTAHGEPMPAARATIETEVVSVFHAFTSEDD